jgi:hypothetical protein
MDQFKALTLGPEYLEVQAELGSLMAATRDVEYVSASGDSTDGDLGTIGKPG